MNRVQPAHSTVDAGKTESHLQGSMSSWRNISTVMWLLVATHVGTAAENVQTVSSRPAASPDGRYMAVVDRLLKVADGEADQFSGGMVVRITDNSTSTVLRQRYLEGTQVRVLQTPTWLDSDWCAFTYNIAKNANGLVYVNASNSQGFQVEMVAPPRRMAASNSIEQELTSLDVSVLGTTTTRIHNVPFKGGSVFPLRLAPLAKFDGRPFGKEFVSELTGAVSDYQALCAAHQVTAVEPEQATESFSDDEKHAALLACASGSAVLCIVPVGTNAQPNAAQVVKLDADVTLNCARSASDSELQGEQQAADTANSSRYTTSWKGDTVQVEREVFDSEDDTSHRELAYTADLNGKLVKIPRPAATPKPKAALTATPEATRKSTVPAPAKETVTTSHTRPLLKVTTRNNERREDAAREPAVAGLSPIVPQVVTPTPVPTKKSSLFDSLIPHRSRATPVTTSPAPPEVQRTPSD